MVNSHSGRRAPTELYQVCNRIHTNISLNNTAKTNDMTKSANDTKSIRAVVQKPVAKNCRKMRPSSRVVKGQSPVYVKQCSLGKWVMKQSTLGKSALTSHIK